MSEALSAGRSIQLYSDEHRTPVHVDDVVAAVRLACDAPEGLGVLNCGGAERVSRVEMGEAVADAMGAPRDLIEATPLAEASPAAPRAADVSMDVTRLAALLGHAPRGFRDGVRAWLSRS